MINLIQGDCIEKMKDIPDNSIDLILTDPPYGTTACKWDSVIPFEEMWGEIERVSKKESAILLFGSEPFSSYLRCSNIKLFKYDIIWEKQKPSNFQLMNYQIGKVHEIISVFSKSASSYTKNKNSM
jgi:site-specific DNA-methyltransferase (adenine-specific)